MSRNCSSAPYSSSWVWMLKTDSTQPCQQYRKYCILYFMRIALLCGIIVKYDIISRLCLIPSQAKRQLNSYMKWKPLHNKLGLVSEYQRINILTNKQRIISKQTHIISSRARFHKAAISILTNAIRASRLRFASFSVNVAAHRALPIPWECCKFGSAPPDNRASTACTSQHNT